MMMIDDEKKSLSRFIRQNAERYDKVRTSSVISCGWEAHLKTVVEHFVWQTDLPTVSLACRLD
jgi:hypothetical protein